MPHRNMAFDQYLHELNFSIYSHRLIFLPALRYNLLSIKSTHLKCDIYKIYRVVSHITSHFTTLKKKPQAQAIVLPLSYSEPQAITKSLQICLNTFAFLNTSYKRNPITWGLCVGLLMTNAPCPGVLLLIWRLYLSWQAWCQIMVCNSFEWWIFRL